MPFPVLIELRPSRVLRVLLAVMHAAAALCILVLPIQWQWSAVALAMVLASAAMAFRSPGIVALKLTATDLQIVRTSEDTPTVATLRPGCTVFSWLVVLRFDCGEEAKTRSLALFPDAVSGDGFRKLRLWVRWNATKRVAVSS